MGHPQGVERGVEATLEARRAIMENVGLEDFAAHNPDSALGVAIKHWGREPKIVY